MTTDSAELLALRRVKRKTYFVCAALFLAGASLHWMELGVFVPKLALLNVAWSVSFVVLGLAEGAGWLPSKWLGTLGVLICLMVVTAYLHFTGGPSSACFPMLWTLPLFISRYSPGSWGHTVLASVTTVGAVLVLDILAGLPPRVMLVQVWGIGLIGLLAVFGARTYRRMRDKEASAQQERLVALEQLAESERRRLRAERERAEVERLVLVGQLASGVGARGEQPAGLREVQPGLPRAGAAARGGAGGSGRAV